MTFCALLDTGADIGLCTRQLAEKLWKWDPKDKVNIKFLEKSPKCFPCMTQTLHLKDSDNSVTLQNIPSIDVRLPYHQYIPSQETLKKYSLLDECFPITERRVDMILGARDMRKLKVFECCVWEENLPNEPLIATHSLGEIYWGMRKDDHSFHHMCAMHRVARASGNLALEILQLLVADQHRISTEEYAEYMPLIMYDISRYYKDQLVLEPDHEDMRMSKDDEEVLAFYEDNLTEICDQRGQKRIELPLPWKKGFPVSIPQSLETARRRVQAQRKRLVQQPERAQKYEHTFQQVKTEGHAEIVPLNPSEEGDTPVHYITHFATPQEKFHVVYNCFSFELASLRLILFCFTIHISIVFSRAAAL